MTTQVSYDEVVHVDGAFACAWTPYRFYEDGKVHHRGTNMFSLWKDPDKGQWVITAVQDIAREEPGIATMGVIGGQDKPLE